MEEERKKRKKKKKRKRKKERKKTVRRLRPVVLGRNARAPGVVESLDPKLFLFVVWKFNSLFDKALHALSIYL